MSSTKAPLLPTVKGMNGPTNSSQICVNLLVGRGRRVTVGGKQLKCNPRNSQWRINRQAVMDKTRML